MASNKKLVEEINDAFINVLTKEQGHKYKVYINAIRREIVDKALNGKVTANDLKAIVSKNTPNNEIVIQLGLILAGVTLLLNNPRMTQDEKKPLLPIIGIMALYSVANPKRFTSNILKATKGQASVKGNELLKGYYQQNSKTITKLINKSQSELVKTQAKASTVTTKRIIKDIGIAQRNKVIDKEQLRTLLEKKYVSDSVAIDRNLDTEIHAQTELVKQTDSLAKGYTHKTWKTQGDNKVRKTLWHNQVANKRIPIDSDFRAGGQRAQHPGDPRLKPSDRIRCRCYLIYD